MRFSNFILAVATCAGLAACGDSTGEQALLGGGAGAVGAAVVSADPLLGAVVGAAGNVLYCKTQKNCY
ncbi:hypothetical protein RUE5091_00402 [Ruegeria denitrificans]|uniref:YMGG-like Gly-zipper domain-containing protein n=1 Tax=Ruegeria denitrificans TaxID=1715692 RepID=A0A0N7M8B8_9RHOB|nr:hypothetical protein [Ruegeria denitrificans]CUJ85903.1 hypothetical protein RUE5091_00402 [Ruegeria denitrificans]